MTSTAQFKLQCSHCGNTRLIEVYKTVNVSNEPELRQKVFNSSLNILVCEKCANETTVDAPVLYHDMKHFFMIQYDCTIQGRIIPKTFQNLPFLKENLGQNYKLRWVLDYETLLEKILILESGADDRLLDILRSKIESSIEGYPDPKLQLQFAELKKKDNQTYVVFKTQSFGGSLFTHKYSLEQIKEEYGLYLDSPNKNLWLLVDRVYAKQVEKRKQDGKIT
ncbi:MAG: hypothetical protein GY845_30080 [Planctomycetes bacterium]|nr:hypothetical protein [Planctomycetota bacterium]